MNEKNIIFETESVCPVCLKKIKAVRVKYGSKVYLEKYCEEHGKFKTIIWDGAPYMKEWIKNKIPAKIENTYTEVKNGCPFDCGLCSSHRQHTCTALIEVTQNCNLKCKFCFASSGGEHKDPDIGHIKFLYNRILKASGKCNIQISGGEPTVRNDLPDIIKMGTDLGFKFIQLNTNGIRIANDANYVESLKKAGLSSIFLQFDGTDDIIYEKLRGRKLYELKKKSIENCKKYDIGVILVPTLVPDVNTDYIGEIINFALDRIPVVRGVHFQPVSYFGRFPEKQPIDSSRITIPEVIRSIEKQTFGKIKAENFKAPCCENSLCSFNGNFIYKGNGELMAVTNKSNSCCSKDESAEVGAYKSKKFVSRNWSGRQIKDVKINWEKPMTWDSILYSIKNYSFSISGMAFQDAWNIDLERLKDCCIHVISEEGNLIPFCAYNLTNCSGKYIYRKC